VLDWLSRAAPGVQRVFLHTAWLSADQVIRLSVGLIVGIVVARYLGPEQFGIYSFALAVSAIAGSLSGLAADPIVTRELVTRRESRDVLGAQFILRTAGSVLAFGAMLGAALLLTPEETGTRLVVVVAGLSLLFSPIEGITTWFQAEQRPQPAVVAKMIVFAVASIARLMLVWWHAPLIAFAAMVAIEAGLNAGALAAAYQSSGERLHRWRASWARSAALFRDSWPLLLSGVSSMLYLRLDVVMVTAMRGDYETGIYSAATRLSEAWYFLPMALMSAVQPVLLRARENDPVVFQRRLNALYVLTAWASVVVAALLTVTATPLIALLFGDRYLGAGPVLALHAWAGIAVFLGVASSQYLVAENLVRISMYRTALGVVANILLNLLLIPHYGALGAAAATVVSYFVATFSLLAFASTRSQAVSMVRAFSPLEALELVRSARSDWTR
jgi:PST family polysaccharide transporter